MDAIHLHNVSKRYPAFTLGPIDLTVPTGRVVGFIGENGAGKSTTIKLILGLLMPDSGSVQVFGEDGCRDLEHVGVVFDSCHFPGDLSSRDIGRVLSVSFRTWSDKAFEDYLTRFDLPRKKPVKDYSRGMQMKLSIACALSHDCRLLLLDEPTSGLDPVVRDEILDIFYDFMQDDSHSILISSHITSDLEKICDYVAFIHQGQIALFEEKDSLLARLGILHADPSVLSSLTPDAILGVRRGQFQTQALVERDHVPSSLPLEPVKLDDILLFLARKEG